MNNKNITVKHLSANIVALGQELKATSDPDLQISLIKAIEAMCTELSKKLV
jgi:hypothetical protein